jgi:hypothetical protein
MFAIRWSVRSCSESKVTLTEPSADVSLHSADASDVNMRLYSFAVLEEFELTNGRLPEGSGVFLVVAQRHTTASYHLPS